MLVQNMLPRIFLFKDVFLLVYHRPYCYLTSKTMIRLQCRSASCDEL